MVKNASDFILALVILILLLPFMLCIALAVKVTSPGPIIFKQRRYGLNGEEIVVYKFRSMTVAEDGPNVVQAKKNDQRFTKSAPSCAAHRWTNYPNSLMSCRGA